MNITSAKFVNNIDGDRDIVEAVIGGITMCVPINPDNRHYQAILDWMADGNTIDEAS